MKYTFSTGLLLLLLGSILSSCNKEYFNFDRFSDEIEIRTDLVAPLIYGSMTLEDIVSLVDSLGYTDVDESGLIYLVYSDTAFTAMADTMVDIPDKYHTEVYLEADITPDWGSVGVGDTAYFLKEDYMDFDLEENDRLDSVNVKSGDFVIDVSSTFKHTGFLTISSDHILDSDGQPFETTILISDLSGNFTYKETFDASDYFIQTEQDPVGDSTYILVNYNLALINSGNPIITGEECEINMSFLDFEFSKVFGYIDSRDLLDESGSIDVPLYENTPEFSSIIFRDPRINIYIANSLGIPMDIELNDIIATSSIDGSDHELIFNESNIFTIGAPGLDALGETVHSEWNLNNSTTNLDEILAIAPSELSYAITGRTSSSGGVNNHFLLDTSKIELELEFLLPMDLKTSGYALQDTVAFGFDNGIDTTLVKELIVRLGTLNGLPVEFGVQVYLTDSLYQVIDSVFIESVPILAAAPVDADGKVLDSVEETNEASFDTEKLQNLGEVSYAIVDATILTTGEGTDFVKLYADYALEFELSVFGDFQINNRNIH